MTEDFYDLLDVPPDASQEAIKRAYREQVRIYHPDLNDDDRAQAQFTALKTAYDVLGDPVERRAYDRLGHMDYCAKRAKNIPSPDQWNTSSDREATSRSTGSRSAQATTSDAGRATGTSAESKTRARATNGGTSRATGRTSRTASASAAGATSSRTDGAGGTVSGAGRSRRSETQFRSSPFANTAVGRWWRARNFAWPLLWIATLTYVSGLVHYGLGHASGLSSIRAELAAAGADLPAAWAVLAGGAHDVPTAYGHVSGVEWLSPPLEPLLWYAALGGVLVLTIVALLGARIAWRERPWGPVSIDETIVFGLALGSTTTLLGGPLLAGALLLPLLFGVVVYRTRQLPGWSPSYAYVLAVSTPAATLGAGAVGVESLRLELVTVLLLPLCGAIGLPLRVLIRKRFGI